MQQKPVLLETLINNAIDSQSGFDRYAATCIALLSTPLEFANPSRAPVFLMKCLERAVQSLSSDTIRPVYLLLSGVESSCLDILPLGILYSLQSQMILVLTNLDSDDHLASLLCLAVLAKFSSRPGGIQKSQPNVQSSPSDETDTESADRFRPARKFFLSRVPKTLDLVVIKAIRSCSQSCQLSTQQTVESLKLSMEIVNAFDKKEITCWLAGNVRKMNKLREKILRSGIETQIQCEALNFVVALYAGELPPPEMMPSLQKYLLASSADVLSANAIEQCIVLLDDASMRELLASLLEMMCDKLHPCRESLTKIDNATRLISVFTEKVFALPKLLKAVLQSISSDVVSGMLRQYASQVQEAMHLGINHDHNAIDVCPLSYREARAGLHQSFSVLVLKSALHAPQRGVTLDAPGLALLLEKQSLHCPAPCTSVECTRRRPINIMTPKVSMFEARSTPATDSVSLSWREGLMREMTRDVDCRYEGVVRMVGEICRDLELRCNETERPLREEQAKSRDLQAKLEDSERDKTELYIQTRSLQSKFGTLETERDLLANQVEATKIRLTDLNTSLNNIHREFDHTKIEAERAAEAANQSARQQDLVYLATITGKNEILEEQSLKLATTENHAQTLEQELNRMRELEAINAAKWNSNESHIETLNIAVSKSEGRVKDLQDELIRTKEQNACIAAKISNKEALIEELKGTIIAVNETSDRNESQISKLKDQLQKAEFGTSELHLQHETYVSAKDAELKCLNESYRSLEDKRQNEQEVALRSAAVAKEQFEATIAALHSKIGNLRKERKERAREFAEAQELSGRLMSLMGTTKRQTSPHGPVSRALGDDKHDLPSSDMDSPDLPAAKPLRSPSLRAPKRIKRRQDPKTPTTCAAKSQTSIDTANEYCRSTMRVDRVPLGSTQVRGPLTQTNPQHRAHHTPKTDGDWELPTENDQLPPKSSSDEEFFAGGDIFTGTDQQQLCTLRSTMPRHEYDESTTDF